MLHLKRQKPVRMFLLLLVCLVTASFVAAQTKRIQPTRPKPLPKQESAPTPPAAEQEQIETVKIDTNLVLVPVAASAAEKAPMKSESVSQIVSFVAACGASHVPATPFFEFDAGEMLEQKESSLREIIRSPELLSGSDVLRAFTSNPGGLHEY